MAKQMVICPECFGTCFKEDYIRAETYCSICGLVLDAPRVEGIVTPGFAIVSYSEYALFRFVLYLLYQCKTKSYTKKENKENTFGC